MVLTESVPAENAPRSICYVIAHECFSSQAVEGVFETTLYPTIPSRVKELSYLHQILALEFDARDHEILVNSMRSKQEMNERGVLSSTMTLTNFADSLTVAFKANV